MPALSVIMTTYNSGKYIREAVESILNQTFADFEFIIIDDSSTDNTFAVLQSFHDQRIKLFQNQRNLGQTKSLNIAIKNSSAELIARMDADDVAYPYRFKTQVDFLEKNKEISVLGGWVHYINEKGKIFRLFKTPINPLEIKVYLAVSGDLSYWCMVHPTVMMRKQVFEKEGLYNEEKGETQGYPQDYDLWSRIFYKYQFSNIPKPLLKYRVLKTSDSRQFNQLQSRLEISARKVRCFLPNLNNSQIQSLSRMLEFLPQESKEEGEKILELFKQYFDQIFKSQLSLNIIQELKRRLICFYLPKLGKTNFTVAFKECLGNLVQSPAIIFNIKFYRKLFKGVLNA